MPLVYAAIEAPTAVVQEKALRIVPTLAESLDYTTVKNSLFPKVQVSRVDHVNVIRHMLTCFSNRCSLHKPLFFQSKSAV